MDHRHRRQAGAERGEAVRSAVTALRRLIIRPGAIGDLIVSLPALEFLRPAEVWVSRPNVPLVRFAESVRAIADTGLDLREIPAPLIERLRGFDEIHSWYGAAREEFREAVASLPFHFHQALPGPGMHATDFYLQQAGAPPGAAPRIHCQAARGDYVVIHPFSGSASKNWPLERFRALAAAMESFAPVHWCAGPEEPLDGAVRFDELYDLACWLASGRLYIGNDSGITHLAAAAGAPVIALFGPTDPGVWAPRGDRVRVIPTLEAGVAEVLAMVDSS